MQWEVIAEEIEIRSGMDHVIFLQAHSVHEDPFVLQSYAVSRQSNHAFDEVLAGINGVTENDNISALDGTVGKQPVPHAAIVGKMQLVSEQKIANEQRVFHGFGRHAKCLHNEGDHEHHDHQYGNHKLNALRSLCGN